jgi:hypothetical protein
VIGAVVGALLVFLFVALTPYFLSRGSAGVALRPSHGPPLSVCLSLLSWKPSNGV